MRRKRPKVTSVMGAAGVLIDDAPATPVDDNSLPYQARKAMFSTFYEAFATWAARREEWAEVHGWPTGEDERIAEERAVFDACPDEPFDPTWELAHGTL